MTDNYIDEKKPLDEYKPSANNPKQGNGGVDLSQITTDLHKYSLFSILKHLESHQDASKPLIGETVSPAQDLFRLYQNPSMSFIYKNIDSVSLDNHKFQIAINEIGLLGANSPLPSHLIEFIFQRKHQYGDEAWASFVNMLQHRILTMFYRSWMNAQSVLSLENKRTDKFSRYIASLAGFAVLAEEQSEQQVEHFSKLYFAGYSLQRNRSADNFQSLLSQYFSLPIRIEENIGQWFKLPKDEQTRLGASGDYTLGDGLIVGSRIYDVQTNFRIVIGPLSLDQYESFFEENFNAKRLIEWVRFYVGEEYDWDVELVLAKPEIPKLVLGEHNKLGLTTWLGATHNDQDHLIISY
ncbi:type VI secretion system baseplate subunit TssG [Psychrobacter sp. FME13]|uniref:type VI secretion system baseplate subunit TssG n=1 Tax=Psychrobacter sp. FME13 TaxID=2487708 RepID=UPI0017888E7C|nr:type VI secretion system baseplate subunit TssG [Psychrobacter sp. FME13]MBE0441220.1 type VI secretion system baseplate subunit TssG [Psychrobacter sp. FME13]